MAMSKLFSIFISLLILLQSLNIHAEDILKLNTVFEEAQLHNEIHNDSFMVFFSKHYGSLKEAHEKEHQEEEKNHNHPPIHHDCSSQISSVFVVQTITFTLENIQNIERTTNFYYQDKFSTFEKQKVFQPPRLS